MTEGKINFESKNFDLLSSCRAIVVSMKDTFLLDVDINFPSGKRKIHYPSLSKSRQYKDRLESSTIRTVVNGEPIDFKIYSNGEVRFKNYWASPRFDNLVNLIKELIDGRKV